MAVRLSVIMVHSAPRTASAERMAESVIGELIGRSGIDVILVGPLAQLGETSTDRLTLASITGDVAVLDWQSPSEIVATLHEIGFQGQRSPHEADPQAPLPTSPLRRIYAFDLARFSGPQEVIAALSRLQSNRQVRTFSLGMVPIASPPQIGPGRATAPQPIVPMSSPRGSTARKQSHVAGELPPPSHPSPNHSPLNLDDLLDQLDRIDP